MSEQSRPGEPVAIIFCSDPLNPRAPDPVFAREAEALVALGLEYFLIDHDAIDRHHDAAAAVRRVRPEVPVEAVYRGWMLRAEDYELLHAALATKGIRLVNSPSQYRACHWGPLAYPFVARWAAPTTWISADRMGDDAALKELLGVFGDAPVVLKDWVKSQAAGYWDACFIPSAAELPAARRVIDRFVELQGDALVGGLVFRAWRELARVGAEVEEWRAFSFDGRPVGCWPRFTGPPGNKPPPELVDAVCAALPSRFATADFARLTDGGWLLIEVGDGQVSGLPDAADPAAVLSALAAEASGN